MANFNILHEVDNQDTKDCFLDALRILLRKRSYKEVTVKDLCVQANFSRKTFYDNFSKKDDLLDHLAYDIALGFSVTDDYSSYNHLFEFFYELREWISLLFQNNLWDTISNKTYEINITLLRERNWEEILENHATNKELIFEFVFAGCMRLLKLWYEDDFKKSPDEMAKLVDYILSGIVIR